MLKQILTQDQRDIIDMLKSLGADTKTIISTMPMVGRRTKKNEESDVETDRIR